MQHVQCELCGYPGAGKTTVARTLGHQFGIVVPALRRAPTGLAARSRWVLSECAEPTLWHSCIPPSSPLKRRKRSVSWLAYCQRVTLAECNGPCVLEEGVIHEIWRLLYKHPDQLGESWWLDFVSRAAPVVLLLDVPPQLALSRIRSKPAPGPINRELLEDTTTERWARAAAALHALRAAIAASRANRLISLDAAVPNSNEVSARIADILRHGGAA